MRAKRVKTGRIMAALLALTLLCGCGENRGGEAQADLQAFMDRTLDRYELGSVEPASEELTEIFYPGLGALETVQRLVYLPLITGVVSEYVLLECVDRDTATRAGELLEARVREQAEGGAWYPESVASWAKARVITKGNYAALIAAGDDTDAIAADFEALF